MYREIVPVPAENSLFEDNQEPISGNKSIPTLSRFPSFSLTMPQFVFKFLPILLIPIGLFLIWYGVSTSVSYTASSGLQTVIFNWQIENIVVMIGLLTIYDSIRRLFPYN